MDYTIGSTEEIRRFTTRNFIIAVEAVPEDYLDLSWDEDGTTEELLSRGDLVTFTVRMTVHYRGGVIYTDYLGQCIYKTPKDFMDHIGLGAARRKDGCNYSSYFSDMVSEAVSSTRAFFSDLPKMREVTHDWCDERC